MRKRSRVTEVRAGETPLDLSHLRRETRTALELAVVAPAPTDLVDRLAWAAGLLEALSELPPDSPPVLARVTKLAISARTTLRQWEKWQRERLANVDA